MMHILPTTVHMINSSNALTDQKQLTSVCCYVKVITSTN